MSNLPRLPVLEAEALAQGTTTQALEFLRKELEGDPRSGSLNLIAKFEKKLAREGKEGERLESLWSYEREAEKKGYKYVAGIDEAGRGPLAGPVQAAAVILPPDSRLAGVDDSKKLTAAKRDELFLRIQEKAVAFGLGQASAQEIDQLNIYRAAQLAMQRAVEAMAKRPDYLLTDAMPLPKISSIPQKPLVHGDALSLSIAAASILAKVTRDRQMAELHRKYPEYGFEGHKGYGTEVHIAALEEHGPCPEHRTTFGPVMEALAKKAAGGPYQFWSRKLDLAGSLAELKQVGLQIKRVALPQLSPGELERLRELFRGKRDQWENPKA